MYPRALIGIWLLAGSGLAQESHKETYLLSNELGLEFGGVVDLLGEFVKTNAPVDDGFDFTGRTFEFSALGTYSPFARFYATTSFEDRELRLDKGAVVFSGLGRNGTLAIGRTLIDFGKQMQLDVHELRTIERPLVLRTFLGEQSWGDGVRYDNWFTSGEQSAVRFSLGIFGRVGSDAEESKDPLVQAFEDDLREPDSIGVSARITGYSDITPTSQFQMGASYRSVPDFTFDFEPSGATVEGLNSGILGVDATFGWADVSGARQWTVGTELLWLTGDIGTTLDDSGTPLDFTDDNFDVLKDDSVGLYLFGDYGWDSRNSLGLQYSWTELPEPMGPEAGEFDVYYTRFIHAFTEQDRLRFGLTLAHHDTLDESVRFVVQYTVGIGAHPREVSW